MNSANQIFLSFAQALALESGQIIRQNFSLHIENTWKLDSTPVTKTDLQVNKLVIDKVSQTFPQHRVLGEEESSSETSEYLWVCDPIDGTIPFTCGIPISTSSLALVHNGQPIVGVIYDPFLERLYSGVVGEGSFLGQQQLQVSQQKTLERGVIDVEAWNGGYAQISSVKDILLAAGAVPVTMCSTAMSGAMVALGKFVGVVFSQPYPWDGAALKVIIEEAGGKVTDLHGKPQRWDQPVKGFIASNSLLHEQLVESVRQAL
jgi:fructose-1,6-bisphosphatase/inositol monophosphatase family enzyme